nr:RimK family alpha-L-glutamate ligase [Candidatus Woesearchaeota archaeon]
MNLAVVSLGGKSSLEIVDEAKNYFTEANNLDIRKMQVNASSKRLSVLYDGKEMDGYQCIYIRGSYRYAFLQRSMTEALSNKVYMPLKPKSFTLAHNKFLTLLEMQKNKVPIPTTYLTATLDGAKKVLEEVNYPIIMKIPEGTQGKGVLFADSLASARSIIDTLDVFKQPYIIQEYVETDATDIRAIVAGDKVIASMRRKGSKNDVRANIHAGGKGEKLELNEDVENVAVKAAKSIDADICAVDLLEGTKTMVIEVNLSPGLQGIQSAIGKNIAKTIAEFLFKKAVNFNDAMKKSDYNKIINDLKNKENKEILANLSIKSGIIKLPEIATKMTEFKNDEEVVLIAEKGKLIVKKI